jgi:hypothetical protein
MQNLCTVICLSLWLDPRVFGYPVLVHFTRSLDSWLFPKANKMEAAVAVKLAPLKRSKTNKFKGCHSQFSPKSCGCQAFRFDSCPIFVPTFSATMHWSIGRAEWCASHARSAPAAGSASRERSSNLGICPTWSAQVESQISQQICKIYTNPSDPSISKGASTIPIRQPPGNVGLRLRMVRLSFRLLRYLALPCLGPPCVM